VVLRLAGKNEKAVRQLALPYGGGKTQTLITLYHLVRDPKKLPDLPAVREFKEAIGGDPPGPNRTRESAQVLDRAFLVKSVKSYWRERPDERADYLGMHWPVHIRGAGTGRLTGP
jgi:hypothetical protein